MYRFRTVIAFNPLGICNGIYRNGVVGGRSRNPTVQLYRSGDFPAQHSCEFGESALPPGKGQVMWSSSMVEERRWRTPVIVGYCLGGGVLPVWFPPAPGRGPLVEWGHRRNPPGRVIWD